MFRSVAIAALAIASLSALPVVAQEHQGHWFGSGEGDIELDLTHIQADQYKISISTLVPITEEFTGCGGGIDGEVLLDSSGGNFFVENEGYVSSEPESPLNARYCEIRLQFQKDGTLILEEREGCMYYHGASCSFTGTLQHDAAGI